MFSEILQLLPAAKLKWWQCFVPQHLQNLPQFLDLSFSQRHQRVALQRQNAKTMLERRLSQDLVFLLLYLIVASTLIAKCFCKRKKGFPRVDKLHQYYVVRSGHCYKVPQSGGEQWTEWSKPILQESRRHYPGGIQEIVENLNGFSLTFTANQDQEGARYFSHGFACLPIFQSNWNGSYFLHSPAT